MTWAEEWNAAREKAREEQIDHMPTDYHLRTLLTLCCLMIDSGELKPDEHTIKAWLPLLRRLLDALKREKDDFMNKDLINRVSKALKEMTS